MLFDTGHQAYVHKLVTGRREGFAQLKQQGGLSGYPSRAESEHDWIENSHASTALSYAHGIATALRLSGEDDPAHGGRHVVAVVGDGALTGGMAYEALNNLGHSGTRVLVVLNDNGRSYAPDGLAAVGLADPAAARPALRAGTRAGAPAGPRASGRRELSRVHVDSMA